MYKINATLTFGNIQLIRDYLGDTREECMAQINYTLEQNPALDYVINSESEVA